jgi:hypothetical protein
VIALTMSGILAFETGNSTPRVGTGLTHNSTGAMRPVSSCSYLRSDVSAGPAQVHVSSPSPGGQVPAAAAVRGTSAHLGAGQVIWVFTINPGGSSLNPQPRPAAVGCDGSWSSQVFVGGAGDAGKPFQILVAVADPAAAAAITAYLADAQRTGSYPGMAALPAGARLADQLTVTRS